MTNTLPDLPAFLDNFFGGEVPDTERALFVVGPPAGKEGGFHHFTDAHPWNEVAKWVRKERPVYVCTSTVAVPSGEGAKLRRRKDDWRCSVAIVFDDVGTKSIASPLTPSYIIETSPGNFQHGFLLDPVENAHPHKVEALLRAAAAATFTDPACVDRNRVVRIPGSFNAKPQHNGFRARLVAFHPDRAWSLEDLAENLGLDVEWKAPTEAPTPERKAPAGTTDPVLAWLTETGFLLRATPNNDDGWFDVRCPNASQHSSPNLTTAGYKAVGFGRDELSRAYKCFHTSCESLDTATFLEWVRHNGGPNASRDAGIEQLAARLNEEKATRRLTVGEVSALLPRTDALQLPSPALTAKGRAATTQPAFIANYQEVFRRAGFRPRLNVMTGDATVIFPDHPDLDYLSAAQVLGVARDLTIHARLPSGPAEVGNMIAMLAHGDPYHPAEDWMKSAPWDGQPRIQALLDTVVVEPDQVELWNLLGRKFLIQCVEAWCGWRDNTPERQVGYVLTFSGAQGIGKSTWFGKLAPGFANTGATLDMSNLHGSRDTKVEVLSAALIEISELDATFRRSDISRLKAFLTQNVDKYRPAYAPTLLTRPRAAVFTATVNDSDFLVDDTGNRRFWPFHVVSFDYEAMEGIDRQQVFAEAYQAWSRGESHHPARESMAVLTEHTAKFVTDHGYEDTLRDFFLESVRLDKYAPKDAVVVRPMKATEVLERLNIVNDWHSRRACARLGDKVLGKRKEWGGAQFGMKGLEEGRRFAHSWRVVTLSRPLTEDEVKKMAHAERAGLTVVGDAT